MTLTKSQKMYGAVMLLAAGAFVYDRATSGPSVAEAIAAKDALPVSEPLSLVIGPEGLIERDGLNSRLANLARAQCLDSSSSDNAFAMPPVWAPAMWQEATQNSVTPSDIEANKMLVDAFRLHHLDAVIVGQRGYANVDGQGVFAGESLEGFKLLYVTKSSAVFGLEGMRVELRLPIDSKLRGKGGVIENGPKRAGQL